MKTHLASFFAATVAMAALSVSAQSQSLVTVEPAHAFTYTGLGRYLGYSFVPVSNLTVYALGVADHADGIGGTPGDGFGDTEHVVRLEDWDDGNLLASVSVCGGMRAPILDGFRYAPLSTPVTLRAGQRYHLRAYYPREGDDRFTTNNGASTVAELQDDPIAFPRYFGPNLLLTPLDGPRLSVEQPAPGRVRVSWSADVCFFYKLESTTDLSAEWILVTDEFTLENGRIVLTTQAGAGTRFYRLRKL